MADTFTVEQFCQRHNISRATLYELWQRKEGPRYLKIGRRTLISVEAAKAWREEMERKTSAALPGKGAGQV